MSGKPLHPPPSEVQAVVPQTFLFRAHRPLLALGPLRGHRPGRDGRGVLNYGRSWTGWVPSLLVGTLSFGGRGWSDWFSAEGFD